MALQLPAVLVLGGPMRPERASATYFWFLFTLLFEPVDRIGLRRVISSTGTCHQSIDPGTRTTDEVEEKNKKRRASKVRSYCLYVQSIAVLRVFCSSSPYLQYSVCRKYSGAMRRSLYERHPPRGPARVLQTAACGRTQTVPVCVPLMAARPSPSGSSTCEHSACTLPWRFHTLRPSSRVFKFRQTRGQKRENKMKQQRNRERMDASSLASVSVPRFRLRIEPFGQPKETKKKEKHRILPWPGHAPCKQCDSACGKGKLIPLNGTIRL